MKMTAQILTGALVFFGFFLGVPSVINGLPADAPTMLDNHFRFFAGIWIGVGLGLAYCIMNLETATVLFRGLLLTIFIGGVARIIGFTAYDPEPRMLIATAIELIFPPALVWMQSRISHET